MAIIIPNINRKYQFYIVVLHFFHSMITKNFILIFMWFQEEISANPLNLIH